MGDKAKNEHMHVVKNHKAQIYGEESSPGGKGDKKRKTSVKHRAVVVEANEELLRSRVSDKYVNDMVKSLEDKISKKMTFSEEKEIERLEKSFKELTAKTVQLN